jgi:hypothetical protein
MVTIVKVKRVEGTDWVSDMERMFEDTHGIDFYDCMLVHDSVCREYEYLYLFMNDYEINTFLNLLVEFKIEILSKNEFTEKMTYIMMNNDIDNFKEKFNGMAQFDDVVRDFGFNNINKDMVLDKILKYGINSLNDIDYKVLES